MNVAKPPVGAFQTARRAVTRSDRCVNFQFLVLRPRCLSLSPVRHATPSLHPTTMRDPVSTEQGATKHGFDGARSIKQHSYLDATPAERAARAAQRARDRLQAQQQKYSSKRQLGGLADNSFFTDKDPVSSIDVNDAASEQENVLSGLSQRNLNNMSLALNPRPNARARWQRKMLIRHIRRRGRLPTEVKIARTERSHLSRSHFFKTSMKKLAPLARQIAGKPIDEAILQMRFSTKKVAQDVREHLIRARDEAIVVKGMGLGRVAEVASSNSAPGAADPGISPALAHQNATKSVKDGFEKHPTDVYVAQAWVNRGPYGMEPEYRARGRVNILRPPWTGISVLLKEEKTRSREKDDKQAKTLRKRMGKTMWLQLPDRPVTRQSQQLLW